MYTYNLQQFKDYNRKTVKGHSESLVQSDLVTMHINKLQTCTQLYNMISKSTEAFVPVIIQCLKSFGEEIHIKCMQPTDHSCTKTAFERPKRLKSESSASGLCGECCDTSHPYQSNYSLVIWTVRGVTLSERMCHTSLFLQTASFSPSRMLQQYQLSHLRV